MTDMTLRQRLEAIHRATQHQDPREIESIREHAYYALRILDDAPYDAQHRVVIYPQARLVHDPSQAAR